MVEMNRDIPQINNKETDNAAQQSSKVYNVVELKEMIEELAMAFDQLNAEVQQLKIDLVHHQHGKDGSSLFPYKER